MMMPTVVFSGMVQPVASLEGGARMIGLSWPTHYYMYISVGAFTKGLGMGQLAPELPWIALFIPVFFVAGVGAITQTGTLIMRRLLGNLLWLTRKEVLSVLRDWLLVGLVIYAFGPGVYFQAQSAADQVNNAAVAFVDNDRSPLSRAMPRRSTGHGSRPPT